MLEKLKMKVKSSKDVITACNMFLNDIGDWAYSVVDKYPEGFLSDSHDGGTFLTCWELYIEWENDIKLLNFMKKYRDNSYQHFLKKGLWNNGYWKKQEAHHGPEHFQIFLYSLWKLDPEDEVTKKQFLDAAEHICYRKENIPEWYDRESGLMKSLYLGTEFIGKPAINVPDHIRFVDLALKAYHMNKDENYLDYAIRYTDRWADAINYFELLPIGIGINGGIYKNILFTESEYGNFAGAAPVNLDDEILKAENLLASGFPDVLLKLWKITKEKGYLKAAEKIIDIALEEVTNPIAWQVQAAIRKYIDITGKNNYLQVINAVPEWELRPIKELIMDPAPERKQYKDAMGMRKDKPDWKDENGYNAPGPLLQVLYGLSKEDDQILLNAVNLARTYFLLARAAYGDVKEHGCTSRALHSIARGHGRLNGAGVVTEVLLPVLYYLNK